MRKFVGIAVAVFVLFGCGKVGGGRSGVAGTYLQESSVPRNSPLLTRIILKEGGVFEMAGMVKLKGTYTLTGTELRLKVPQPPPEPGMPEPGDVVCTLRDGVIDVPAGLEGVEASRFKKYDAPSRS